MITSNFSQHRKHKFDGGVSIAAGQPKWVRVPYTYSRLAPSYKLLGQMRRGEISPAEYAVEYNKYLATLDAKQVFNQLHELVLGVEPVLMCHCKSTDFCHRQLAAAWLESELGIRIPEFGQSGVIRVDGYLQLPKQESLF